MTKKDFYNHKFGAKDKVKIHRKVYPVNGIDFDKAMIIVRDLDYHPTKTTREYPCRECTLIVKEGKLIPNYYSALKA